MRNVIATVKIVVDENFPVAVDVVGAPVEIMQLADAERCYPLNQPTQKVGKRRGVLIQIHKNEALPCIDSNWDQTIFRAIEILHTLELGHAFERPIKPIVPAVIRTMQHCCVPAGLSNNGGSVM